MSQSPPEPWRFTEDPAVAALDEAAARYRDAWGAWMVGHHHGKPVTEAPDGEGGLERDLVAARRALAAAIGRIEGPLSEADATAIGCLRSAVADLDAWSPVLDGLAPELHDTGDRGGSAAPGGAPASAEPPETAALRRRVFDAWGEAMAAVDVGDERLDRLTATARLARLERPADRRDLFLAMAPGWQAVDGDGGPSSPYRRLLQSSAAQWAATGSPIDRNARALGLDPGAVERIFRTILARFREAAMPRRGLVEPWDYRYVVGGLARRVDPGLGVERLRPVNDAHLAAIGADPARLGIHYDIYPRGGRPVIPTAFTTTVDVARRDAAGAWRAATPWVFATYAEGGLGNLEELLHESGHAIHYAAVRARPAEFEAPADQVAFVEAIADVVGWTVHEPAFLDAHLGVAVSPREMVLARHGAVMLDLCWSLFEIALHREPDRRPNDVWAEIMERDLGVAGHPEWSWWAARGQLIDGPGYLANYALGAIVVAAVRARIRELRGDWSAGDPGWYPFVAERLLRFGGGRPPAGLIRDLLGAPLGPEALLTDVDRAG